MADLPTLHSVATESNNESAKAPSSEKLSTSMTRLLDDLSAQLAHQCEFVMMLENEDLGPAAEALAFAMLATIKEVHHAYDGLSDVAQRLAERERSREVSHA